jgi:hypothetical protein
MTKKVSGVAVFATLGLLTLGSAGAQAADLSGYDTADLEERIAELEATTARKGNRKVSLTISGYVNEQIQWWDDGGESNVYQGTNESDQTRFRFLGKAKINADWSAGYLLEFGAWGARQGQYNANNDDAGSSVNSVTIRHSAWYLQSATIGKFTLGQTSAANDGITELTLAKTITVDKPIQIFTPNAGFSLRRNGSITGNATWNQLSTIPQAGEGDRYNVIRYDTPVFAGFTASASWGEDDLWAVALRYAGEFSGFRLAAGIGYSAISDGAERNLVDLDGGDGEELGLTASVLHVPTGLFATFTYGRAEDHDRKLIAGVTGDTDEGWNIQAGIQRNFIPLGATTLYGEYYQGDFGTAVNLSNDTIRTIGGQDVLSTDVDVWGLAAIQSIDAAALDLYIAYRHYEADVTTTGGAKITGIDNFQTVFGGAKISF